MPDSLPISIIRSKLYQSHGTRGLINRDRSLKATLNCTDCEVMLVSAPAGYGKTTFVSQYIHASGRSCAWLSLDHADGDLRRFLCYVVAALRSAFPNCCPDTAECLRMPTLQPAEELAGVLGNDLDQLGESVTLVLDDYHCISASEVHDVINAIIRRPPRNLQVVIITRRDPPLSLQTLRASGTLTEIRMQQLAFSKGEADEFVRHNLGDEISDKAITRLYHRTEGWPAALRLATLAAPNRISVDAFVDRIPGNIHEVREYLLHEVLAKCSPEVHYYLLRTAFLDRFCAPLCEAVMPDTARESAKLSGECFMNHIREAGLFSVALDSEKKWFRYHGLFQIMLQDRALSELGADEIRDIRMRASRWFEDRGLLDDAIQQLVGADESTAAAELICRYRNRITNLQRWQQVESWLALLPQKSIDDSPELLLLLARCQDNRSEFEESWATVDKVARLLESRSLEPRQKQQLLGSIEALRCFQHYAHAESERAAESARHALEWLPVGCTSEREFAKVILARALQLMGESGQARKFAIDEARCATGTYRTQMLTGLAHVQWVDADLQALRQTALQFDQLEEEASLAETQVTAGYFRAVVQYHENRLTEAEATSSRMVHCADAHNGELLAQSLCISAIVNQELGELATAQNSAKSVFELGVKHQSRQIALCADGISAELALRNGRMSEALKWAARFDPELLVPYYNFYEPTMTLAKVLVLDDGEASRVRVSALLERLVDHLTQTHNQRFLAEVLALRAMYLHAVGKRDAAAHDLITSIKLAQPGRFIRLFVDLGPRLGSLLHGLDLDEESLAYVGEILAAFRKTCIESTPTITHVQFATPDIGLEPLSKREHQILVLLSERLSDKEIANQLNISPVTVKRHAANIYQKLSVHSRRQAVAKAAGLGVFSAAG